MSRESTTYPMIHFHSGYSTIQPKNYACGRHAEDGYKNYRGPQESARGLHKGFAYRSPHDNQKVIIQDVVTTYQGQTQGLFIWASKLWFR